MSEGRAAAWAASHKSSEGRRTDHPRCCWQLRWTWKNSRPRRLLRWFRRRLHRVTAPPSRGGALAGCVKFLSTKPFATEANVGRQINRIFFGGKLPLFSCAVELLLWDSFHVTSSPVCERLQRQTKSTAPPTCVVARPWRPHSFKRGQPTN